MHTGRKQFLNDLRKRILKQRPELNVLSPADLYCQINLDDKKTKHKDVHLEWLVFEDDNYIEMLGVELHFERETQVANMALLTKLEQQKTNIEKSIGEPLVFQPAWTTRWSAIFTQRQIENTPAFYSWAVDTMIKYYDAFKPLLDKIDT